MKKTHIITVISALLILYVVSSCTYKKTGPDTQRYVSLYYSYFQRGLYDSVAIAAGDVFSSRDKIRDRYLVLYSGLQCAQAAVFLDDYPRAAAYLDTMASFRDWDNFPELSAVHDVIRALYEIKDGFDYPSALIHLTDALNYYRSTGDALNTCVVLGNVSIIYFFRRDTTGIHYAREAVGLGLEHGDNPYIMCIADVVMSTMLLLKKDYAGAEEYALAAKEIADRKGYTAFDSRIYMVLAEVAMSRGDMDGAAKMLDKGFQAVEGTVSDYYFELALTKGKMLIQTRRWDEATEFLSQTLEMVDRNRNVRYRYQFLHLLAELYDARGNTSEAYSYYRKSIASKDSIVNVDKEAAFNNLLDMYGKASHQSELRKKQNDMNLIIFVCVVSILAAGFILFSYIRQRRLNKSLVQLNQEYLKRNEMLRKYLEPKPEDVKITAEEELFGRLEKLMRQEHIYRHKDISLDKLALMLSTNRTYVSRTINKFADKSFWGYINMYRIAEATQILSDLDNEIQIKNIYEVLGYNSPSSFFRVFREETGITPSEYREEIRRKKVAKS